ncbi:GreA/GreB family elongation factor [gamma proteobacterium HTCC5015]|nr:GreA/GreB family elongation factor [gamma proteobacterium HTCC5015]
MTDKVPMTVEGAEAMREELTQLKSKERPEIIQAIAEAREHGDLKENAEYHAARERQGFVEGRIKEIEGKLSYAQIIDVQSLPKSGKVVFGVTVELCDIDTEEEKTYKIVGEDEANIQQGKISFTSPVARSLIGREEGDCVLVKTPGGDHEYEILAVRYE